MTPLFLCFMVSILISLILLGITVLFSSRILTRIKMSFFFDETLLLKFFFFIFIYCFVYLIPLPKELFAAKMRLLLILGGSSAILFIILAKSFQSKFIFFTYFFLSTLSVCLCLEKTNVAFIILLMYLTVFFFPININRVFLSLLIVRTFSFEEWGFALFMQLAFLFGFKKFSVNYTLFLFFFLFWVFILLVPGDPILKVKSILYPLSGALAISFLYIARSGKEHLVTYLLYFCNGLFLCLFCQHREAAYYFLILNLFLLFILAYMTFIDMRIQNKELFQFPSEFFIFIFEGKQQYLLQFYGVILLLVTFYSYKESWMTHWTFSLVLQVGFIKFLTFFLK